MYNTKSHMGYRWDSPYKDDPFIDIFTPGGLIDMSQTDKDLIGIDEYGNKKKMKAGRKHPYRFKGQIVREIPLQVGGKIPGYIPPAYSERSMGPTIEEMRLTQAFQPDTVSTKEYETIKRLEREGVVKKAGPRQNKVAKAIEIASHPATAAEYVVQNKPIPDNFSRGNVNRLDNVLDFINPAGVAQSTVEIPQNLRDENYAAALMNTLNVLPTTRMAAGVLKPYAKAAESMLIGRLNDKFINPIRFRNEISQVRELYDDIPRRFSSPEGIKRLQEAGIDPALAQIKPKLRFRSYHPSGSHYEYDKNVISMDMNQAARLKAEGSQTATDIFEHELGHKLQADLFKTKYPGRSKLRAGDDFNKYWTTDVSAMDDVMRMSVANPQDMRTIGNLNYFAYPKEGFAHLREMRQQMVDNGFIKDIYDPISSKDIGKFMEYNPNNRISSFVGEYNKGNLQYVDPDNLNILKKAMNTLPVAAPVVAAGAAAVAASDAKKDELRKGGLSAGKAKEMLKDGTAHKQPLTNKQKKYFRAIAHGWKPKQEGGTFSYNPYVADKNPAFQNWYYNNTIEGRRGVPFSDDFDYDYYSYYMNGGREGIDSGHFTDAFKKPNHPTFSDESIYSVPENPGGHWNGEEFTPYRKMQQGGNPYEGNSMEDLVSFLFEEDAPAQEIQQTQAQEDGEMDLRELEIQRKEREVMEEQQYNEALMLAMYGGMDSNPYAEGAGGGAGFSMRRPITKYTKENVGDKEKYSYQFFINKGYSPQVAAGLVANIKHESNFNPNAVGDAGKARGIAQWHPDRYSRLNKEFDLASLTGSLEALHYELQTSERPAYEKIKGAQTPEQAAAMVDKYFERSAGLSTDKRMNTARNIYNIK